MSSSDRSIMVKSMKRRLWPLLILLSTLLLIATAAVEAAQPLTGGDQTPAQTPAQGPPRAAPSPAQTPAPAQSPSTPTSPSPNPRQSPGATPAPSPGMSPSPSTVPNVTPGTPSTSPAAAPAQTPGQTPQQTPASSPSASPAPPGPGATPGASPGQGAAPSAGPGPSVAQGANSAATLTLDDTIRLGLGQVSAYQQAGISEKLAAEDLLQAKAALLPRLNTTASYTYNTPLLHPAPDTPRAQSFISLNGISEYLAFFGVTGDLDISGRLHATIRRNAALLESARLGTLIARRVLVQAVGDAYYGLALATARRRGAEQNLAAAQDFERITAALLSGGEVAPVDLTRAQLQTATRRDELEQARANEVVAAAGLRVLIGYDFTRPVEVGDLTMAMPIAGEIEQFTADAIKRRPEFAQFEADRRAAQEDIRIARSERRPQLSYVLNTGIDSDSLRQPRVHEHIGASGALNLTVPIFDFGASKSRERQARLRAQAAELTRTQEIRAFSQQFYTAQDAARSGAARIRLAGAAVREAERNLSVSIARYRGGEAQIIEVTDAQTTLAAQRVALYQAIFDYQTARARLLQAVGQ